VAPGGLRMQPPEPQDLAPPNTRINSDHSMPRCSIAPVVV